MFGAALDCVVHGNAYLDQSVLLGLRFEAHAVFLGRLAVIVGHRDRGADVSDLEGQLELGGITACVLLSLLAACLRVQFTIVVQHLEVLHDTGAQALALVGAGGLVLHGTLDICIAGADLALAALRRLHELGHGFLVIEGSNQSGAQQGDKDHRVDETLHVVNLASWLAN